MPFVLNLLLHFFFTCRIPYQTHGEFAAWNIPRRFLPSPGERDQMHHRSEITLIKITLHLHRGDIARLTEIEGLART